MKTSKFKFAGWYFIATAIILSTIFTACQKEETLKGNPLEQADEIIGTGTSYLYIPEEIRNKGEKEILKYVRNLTYEEYQRLEETTRIKAFLQYKGIARKVNAIIIEKLAETDMANHLSLEELKELSNFDHQKFLGEVCYEESVKLEYTIICDSRTKRLKYCGDVFGCNNDTWLQLNEPYEVACYYTGIPCQGSGPVSSPCGGLANGTTIDSSGVDYLDQLVCEPAPYGDPLYEPTTQAFSRQAAQGNLSTGSQKIQRLFIANQAELMQIFMEDHAKNQPAKMALQEFLLVNDFVLRNGLSDDLGNATTIGQPHISAFQNLIDEVAAVSGSPKLKADLMTLSTKVKQLEGKTLKSSLSSFEF